MNFSISRQPLFMQVKVAILEGIHSGDLGKDSQLPPEKILCERFRVSRATIRSALQSLEVDNVIRKQHGVGTFILPDSFRLKMRIDKVNGFYQLIGDSGHHPSIREEGIYRELINDKTSYYLKLSMEEEVLLLKRTFMGDGNPAIHVCEYIPLINIIHNPEPHHLPASIFDFADAYCSDKIQYSVSEIIPMTANAVIAKTMNLPKNEPILKLEEIHFSRNDKPILFSEVYVNDRIIRFNVFRTGN
jgi:GntR family transcriptional regulator